MHGMRPWEDGSDAALYRRGHLRLQSFFPTRAQPHNQFARVATEDPGEALCGKAGQVAGVFHPRSLKPCCFHLLGLTHEGVASLAPSTTLEGDASSPAGTTAGTTCPC